MRWSPLLAAILAVSPTPGRAQEPVRAQLLGSLRPGRPVPPIVLPSYSSSECRAPSPECRAIEFRLAGELGRVVVVAFGGRPDPAVRIDWAALARRADSLGSPRIALVGVVRAGSAEARVLSSSLGGSLRVLADSGGRIHRQFGVGDRDRDWTFFVVADDGTLVARERVSTLADGEWWPLLAEAIRRGFTAVGR